MKTIEVFNDNLNCDNIMIIHENVQFLKLIGHTGIECQTAKENRKGTLMEMLTWICQPVKDYFFKWGYSECIRQL